MRYTEIKTAHAALEGRSWTAADDTKLLKLQIDKADNIRGLFPYAQNIHLTNAVKLIAMRPDCKWFFDFLTTQLHYLGANGVTIAELASFFGQFLVRVLHRAGQALRHGRSHFGIVLLQHAHRRTHLLS